MHHLLPYGHIVRQSWDFMAVNEPTLQQHRKRIQNNWARFAWLKPWVHWRTFLQYHCTKALLVVLCLCIQVVSVGIRVCSLTTPENYTQLMLHQCEYQQCKLLSTCLFGQKKQCQSGAQLRQAWNRRWTVQAGRETVSIGQKHIQGVIWYHQDVHIHSCSCQCVYAPNQAWPHFILPT